jgi:hypothetical protein
VAPSGVWYDAQPAIVHAIANDTAAADARRRPTVEEAAGRRPGRAHLKSDNDTTTGITAHIIAHARCRPAGAA